MVVNTLALIPSLKAYLGRDQINLLNCMKKIELYLKNEKKRNVFFLSLLQVICLSLGLFYSVLLLLPLHQLASLTLQLKYIS